MSTSVCAVTDVEVELLLHFYSALCTPKLWLRSFFDFQANLSPSIEEK